MKWWLLYCAMQTIPASDPTVHFAFDSQAKCQRQATVSNSFGELHCVCAQGPASEEIAPLIESYLEFL